MMKHSPVAPVLASALVAALALSACSKGASSDNTASEDVYKRQVWHLDVGSSHPGAGVGPKGWAVRPLKRYASWVQNVVRQFGPYPLCA